MKEEITKEMLDRKIEEDTKDWTQIKEGWLSESRESVTGKLHGVQMHKEIIRLLWIRKPYISFFVDEFYCEICIPGTWMELIVGILANLKGKKVTVAGWK